MLFEHVADEINELNEIHLLSFNKTSTENSTVNTISSLILDHYNKLSKLQYDVDKYTQQFNRIKSLNFNFFKS